MGRRVTKRVAYIANSVCLVPLADNPGLFQRVPFAVATRACGDCGRPAGSLCVGDRGAEWRSGFHADRQSYVREAHSLEEKAGLAARLVADGAYDEVVVMEQRAQLRSES